MTAQHKLSKSDIIDIAYAMVKIEGPLKGLPQEMSYAEATKKLFHGKPKRWVTRYILARFPEVWKGPDAWITKPMGKGHPIKVTNAPLAAAWLLKHEGEIDWTAEYPETISRRFKQTA